MITKNYIKMCEKFEELQQNWQPKEGDRFIYRNDFQQKVIIYRKESNEPAINVIYKMMFYLPTQEQLQEILQEKWIYYGSYPLSQFCGWIMTTGGPNKFYHHQYKDRFKSINELWLVFVMKEKYNKIWNGETWVAKKS